MKIFYYQIKIDNFKWNTEEVNENMRPKKKQGRINLTDEKIYIQINNRYILKNKKSKYS